MNTEDENELNGINPEEEDNQNNHEEAAPVEEPQPEPEPEPEEEAQEEEDDEHEEVNEIPVFSEEEEEQQPEDAASESKEHAVDAIEGTYTKEASQKPREDSGYFKTLDYHNDGAATVDEDIDSRRQVFAKTYNGNKVFSIVTMIVLVAIFVVILVLAFIEVPDWVTWTCLGIGVALIVAALIVSHFMSKKVEKKAMSYLHEYQDVVSSYLVEKTGITDATLGCDATIDDQDFIQAHYFSTINSITSRSVVVGQRNGHNINMAEISVNVPPRTFDDGNKRPEDLYNLDGSRYNPADDLGLETSTQEIDTSDMTMVDIDLATDSKQEKKKQKEKKSYEKDSNNATEVGLFGRFIAYDYKVRSEQSFIITVLGEKQYSMLPDYTSGFYAIKVPGLKSNIVVYAVQPVLVADIFNADAVDILNSIEVSTNIQSLFISCNSYGTRVGINLADDMVELPIEKNPPLGGLNELSDLINKILGFVDGIEALNENSGNL